MTEPIVTVAVLAVLWLIVVVPMIMQRKDARAGSRSVARFSAAMRALSRRSVIDTAAPTAHPQTPTIHVSGAVDRKPVPVSKESLMHAPDRFEMSPARRQMMARRRRSLVLLTAGLVVVALLAVLTGSRLLWAAAALFALALAGYLLFLRGQAQRDNARRENRRIRAPVGGGRDYDATAARHVFTDRPEAVVQIDEDDVALDHFDTIDLTGLYTDEDLRQDAAHRDLRRAG